MMQHGFVGKTCTRCSSVLSETTKKPYQVRREYAGIGGESATHLWLMYRTTSRLEVRLLC